MSSPGNGYPQRGTTGMFTNPMNSTMFPRAQSTPRFSPVNSSQGMYSPYIPQRFSPINSSQGRYSPNNSSQGRYSPNNSSQYFQSSQNGYSPRNQFKGGYSSRNSSSSSSVGFTSTRSASPLHQLVLRQSFNKSKDSSGVSRRSSLDSTDNSRRFTPYDTNKRNNQGRNSYNSNNRNSYNSNNRNSWNSNKSYNMNKSYNIQDYILPSMLEDPWAGLKADRNKIPVE